VRKFLSYFFGTFFLRNIEDSTIFSLSSYRLVFWARFEHHDLCKWRGQEGTLPSL